TSLLSSLSAFTKAGRINDSIRVVCPNQYAPTARSLLSPDLSRLTCSITASRNSVDITRRVWSPADCSDKLPVISRATRTWRSFASFSAHIWFTMLTRSEEHTSELQSPDH